MFNGDHIDGMQPPAVGIKVGHDFKGQDLCIESLGVLKVIVPNLVDNIAEEFGDATFGCLEAGVVVKEGFGGGRPLTRTRMTVLALLAMFLL
jgi:hypothetical protein